jgi:hypothetical protein
MDPKGTPGNLLRLILTLFTGRTATAAPVPVTRAAARPAANWDEAQQRIYPSCAFDGVPGPTRPRRHLHAESPNVTLDPVREQHDRDRQDEEDRGTPVRQDG